MYKKKQISLLKRHQIEQIQSSYVWNRAPVTTNKEGLVASMTTTVLL